VVNVQDLTERRRNEEERERLLRTIETERNWLRTVIDESPIAVLLFEGADGGHVVANPRAEALLGRRLVPGRGNAQLVGAICAPDGRPLPREQMLSTHALLGETARQEQLVVRPDGGEIPILASAAPIHGAGGEIVGAVVAFEDITRAKELERLREEWTSVVAHDLRQPVSVIALSTSLLPGAREGDAADRER
jgi:PAS domain S-box-containing protein